MMKSIFFIWAMMFPLFAPGQEMDITWDDDFRKIIQISCTSDQNFCNEFCDSNHFCEIQEDICHNCIGTNFKVLHIFSELGVSFYRNELYPINSKTFMDFIKDGNFVTFKALDVYNVIDAFGSVKVYEKFESLCPEGSMDQILFLQVTPVLRELVIPSYVLCRMEESTELYDVKTELNFEINGKYRWGKVY